MTKTDQDLETQLLAILNQPDKSDSLAEAIEKVTDGDESLTDEQRATLARLLNAGLPSPDSIVRDAKAAEHNAKIERARQADLARRRERRAKRSTPRRK